MASASLRSLIRPGVSFSMGYLSLEIVFIKTCGSGFPAAIQPSPEGLL
jgi:hypothetical protein